MAVVREQEMKAAVQEMRAKVVEAEAEIPMAISSALREGKLMSWITITCKILFRIRKCATQYQM